MNELLQNLFQNKDFFSFLLHPLSENIAWYALSVSQIYFVPPLKLMIRISVVEYPSQHQPLDQFWLVISCRCYWLLTVTCWTVFKPELFWNWDAVCRAYFKVSCAKGCLNHDCKNLMLPGRKNDEFSFPYAYLPHKKMKFCEIFETSVQICARYYFNPISNNWINIIFASPGYNPRNERISSEAEAESCCCCCWWVRSCQNKRTNGWRFL